MEIKINKLNKTDMTKSLEIRWFTESNLEYLLKHYEPKVQKPKERKDYYLSQKVIPESSWGVKLREGDFEVKLLNRIVGENDFGNGVTGIVQEWQKGIKMGIDKTFEQNLSESIWVEVKKERSLFKYDCAGDNAILINSGDRVQEGCNGEITKVTVYGKVYWSIALEAFGSDTRVKENFEKAVKVFPGVKVAGLSLENSKSYPEFLSGIENSSEETKLSSNAIETELSKINEDFSKAELNQDEAFFQGILSDELAFRRANGKVVSKQEFLDNLADMSYEVNTTNEIKIRQILPDTYAVGCVVEAKGERPDGSPFEGSFSNSRLFKLADGKFSLFCWHNTKI